MARQPPSGRPRLEGGKCRHVQQYKLNAERVDKKLCVLVPLATTKDIRATITHFYPFLADGAPYNTKRTQICRWKRSQAKLQAAAAAHQGAHKKAKSVRVGALLPSVVEGEIVQWVNDLRKDGIPISAFMLRETAKERATEAGVQQFRTSSSWIDGFKARHHFSMQSPTRQGQIRPEDIEAVSAFSAANAADVRETMDQLGIDRVMNADQTGCVLFSLVLA